MENLINDDLDLSSSDNESDSESDNNENQHFILTVSIEFLSKTHNTFF